MTPKKLGYVELEWVCPSCGTRNPGSVKTCKSCGSPQPTDVQFEQPQNQALITDKDKLAQAQKGPDIHCPYCGTRNPADAAVCSNCGGDLKTGQKREAGKVVGAFSAQPVQVQQIPCPRCATLNPSTNTNCQACGATMKGEPAAAQPAAPVQIEPKKGRNFLMLGIGFLVGLVIVCVAAYMIYNSTRRESLSASVQNVNWSRMIAIQELRDATHSGWLEDIPAEAKLGSCELQEHHTQAEPAANSNEVCGTPYTKDTGSGFGEVVQDCVYVVYQDYCEYTVTEWQTIDRIESTGQDLNPAWPALNLLKGQRQGEQEQSYTVIFSTDQGTYTYSAASPDEFQKFTPGSTWILVLNGFNQVVGVEAK